MLGLEIIEELIRENDCSESEAYEIFNVLYGDDPYDNYNVEVD